EHVDVPADVPARLVTALASGKYDALSGRFLTIADDLERLRHSAGRIDHEQLFALRVNRLPMPDSASVASRSITNDASGPCGKTLRLECMLPLTIEEAFTAWIDPDAIAQWFVYGADVRWVVKPDIDPQPGGGFHFHVAGAGGAFEFAGHYREITKYSRLEFTWRWRSLPILDGPGDTTVVVEFEQGEG